MLVIAGLSNRDFDEFGLYGYATLTDGCLLEGVDRAFFPFKDAKRPCRVRQEVLGHLPEARFLLHYGRHPVSPLK